MRICVFNENYGAYCVKAVLTLTFTEFYCSNVSMSLFLSSPQFYFNAAFGLSPMRYAVIPDELETLSWSSNFAVILKTI